MLGYQILHIQPSFHELHLVHIKLSVPEQEDLSLEHGSKLLINKVE